MAQRRPLVPPSYSQKEEETKQADVTELPPNKLCF